MAVPKLAVYCRHVNLSMGSGLGSLAPAGQISAPATNSQIPQMMNNPASNQNLMSQVPLGTGSGEPTVQPTTRKDWHAKVSQDLRDHLVHKMVQAIFPDTLEPTAYRDSRMKSLVAYARKVEGDAHETASDRVGGAMTNGQIASVQQPTLANLVSGQAPDSGQDPSALARPGYKRSYSWPDGAIVDPIISLGDC
nr:hypothetical protein BaRGS_019672 [Batillaria attramentaria]